MKRLTSLLLLLALLLSALACTKEVERVVVVTPTGPPMTATPQSPATATLAPTPSQSEPESQAPPTPLPNRANCAEITGTEYRSPAERQWFLDNCVPTPEPAPATAPPPPLPPLPAAPPPLPSPPPPPPSACGGLPTYSEVLATYSLGASLCQTNVLVREITVRGEVAWQLEGVGEMEGGELQRCYGMKLEVAPGGTLTINGVTYLSGAKLTVDKNLNFVAVCSWD